MDEYFSLIIIIIIINIVTIIIVILYLNNGDYDAVSGFTNFSGNGSAIFDGRDIVYEPRFTESLHPIYV